MMGCFPKPVHANVIASIQDYRGLSHKEEILVFVTVLQQLRARLNEAYGKAETFAFLGALLLTVEKLIITVVILVGVARSLFEGAYYSSQITQHCVD